MRYFFIFLVKIYQKIVSPETGFITGLLGIRKKTCIYYPSCSQYSIEAFKKHGSLKGIFLTVSRIVRCNPFNEPRVDEVPEKLSFRRKLR